MTDRRLLVLLGLAVVFEGYGRSLVSVTLSYIGRDLGAAPAELSYALAFIATGALGVLVIGPLADRLGRRRLLLGCVLLYSLFGAATALSRTLVVLVLWQAVARMFQEGALYTAAVIAAEETPAAHRGVAQGVLGTANTLGAGLVAFLLAAIEYWPGGWRGLCLVSLVPLALLPFLARAIPESQRWLARRDETRRVLPAGYRRRLLAALAVVLLGTSYDIAGLAFTAYTPMASHGWSAGATSAMIVVAGGLGLPGWWAGGWLADWSGRRPAAVVFLLGLTLAEVVFYAGGPAALWPGFAAMVFFQGGKTAVLRSWSTELFPTSVRATAAGYLAAGATVGGMAGLALAGLLTPVLGSVERALTLIAATGVLAAGAAYRWLPETRGLELEEI